MTAPQPTVPQPPWWSQPHVIALIAALLGSNGLQLYSASGKIDPATAELLAADKIERLRDNYEECKEIRRHLRDQVAELRGMVSERSPSDVYSVPDVAAPPVYYDSAEEAE